MIQVLGAIGMGVTIFVSLVVIFWSLKNLIKEAILDSIEEFLQRKTVIYYQEDGKEKRTITIN